MAKAKKTTEDRAMPAKTVDRVAEKLAKLQARADKAGALGMGTVMNAAPGWKYFYFHPGEMDPYAARDLRSKLQRKGYEVAEGTEYVLGWPSATEIWRVEEEVAEWHRQRRVQRFRKTDTYKALHEQQMVPIGALYKE